MSGSKCLFADGKRRVDYVLAYELAGEPDSIGETKSYDMENEDKLSRRRQFYETTLKVEGLELEFINAKVSCIEVLLLSQF